MASPEARQNSFQGNIKASLRSSSSATSIIKAYSEDCSDFHTTPSSLQGMLKNTTETGDIGAFSIRPSQVPQSTSRLLARSPHIEYNRNGLPQHQIDQFLEHEDPQYPAQDGRLNSMQSYNGTTASSIVSMYQSQSQKPSKYHPRPSPQGSNRAFSMSQSSHVSYTLSSHRSYSSLRPRSPFVYPTRLKRPGYRPSSPALTDFNGTDSRTHVGLEKRDANFWASSPLSVYRSKPPAIAFSRDANNRSTPRMHNPRRSQGHGVDTLTRQYANQIRPGSSQNNRSTVLNYQRRLSGDKGWKTRESAPPSPLYYDYSEPFEEQRHVHDCNISILNLADQQIGQHILAAEPYGLSNGQSVVGLAKMPESFNSFTVNSTSHGEATEGPPTCETTAIYSKDDAIGEDNLEPKPLNVTKHIGIILPAHKIDNAGVIKEDKKAQEPSIGDTIGHHNLSSSKTQRIKPPFVTGYPTSTLSSPPSVVSRGCTRSMDFSKALTIKHDQALRPMSAISNGGMSGYDLPSRTVIEASLPGNMVRGLPSSMMDNNLAVIHAPVPERSMSSRSHQQRYSRILSINDSFPELAKTALKSEVKNGHEFPTGLAAGQSKFNTDMVEAQSCAPVTKRPTSSNYSLNRPSLDDSMKDVLGMPLDYACEVRTGHSREPSMVATRSSSSKLTRDSIITAGESATYQGTGRHETYVHKALQADTLKKESLPAMLRDINPSKLEETQARCYHSRTQMKPSSTLHPTLASQQSLVCTADIRNSSATTHPKHGQCQLHIENAAKIRSYELDNYNYNEASDLTERPGLGKGEKSASKVSSVHSRPWDLDTTYAWSDEQGDAPNIQNEGLQNSNIKAPKFKLKVIRASSSTNGTIKLSNADSTRCGSPSRQETTDFFRTGGLLGRSNSQQTNRPETTQQLSPVRTMFTRGIDTGPSGPPHIMLKPPSPSLRFADVQSFFSDDSEEEARKMSLMNRFSQFKILRSISNSTDTSKGPERTFTKLFEEGAQSGRRIERSENLARGAHVSEETEEMSTLAYAKCKISSTLKSWWLCWEGKLRSFGVTMKKTCKKSPEGMELYGGA